ncbi:transient receptor potential channel pyrexia-like [Daktulosphaira vitifoliae]|uniref:transient receptor potential channel pyrexia-like n=1 Tax=Daktulosphaira vitifoliae TaxID=58002 RepID=UPI0021A98C5C|nr:transient receptor potential channel pyrexia-like [Daktulosphaira vitifoliae]
MAKQLHLDVATIPLDRTISLNVHNRHVPSKSKSSSPSVKDRWYSFRGRPRDDRRSNVEEFLFMESLPDEVAEFRQIELSIIICKDTIRQDLMDSMRTCNGRLCLLQQVEQGTFDPEQQPPEPALNQAELDRLLCWAIYVGATNYLDYLYENRADIGCTHCGSFTAIHLAAFMNNVDALRWLIDKNCDINTVQNGYTPLHSAVMGNALETTMILIENRCDIQDTVLHGAVQMNSLECVKYILQIGVDPNTYDAHGNTPLHLAADKGYTECLKLLLTSSTKTINLKSKTRQATALHMAAENGYTQCVRILLNNGSSHSVLNDKYQTALHLASKAQCAESVEILLELGAEVNALDIDKRTPLHSAVCKAFLSFHVVEVLVKWGADVNIQDRYGYAPLHIAALNELSQCVDFLIIKGADISSRTIGGMSALSIINRKTPTSINTIKKKFDQAISLNDPEASIKEVELKMDFRYLLQNPRHGEIILLHTLEECGQKSMLEHPLCEAFLYLKWQKIRRFYFVRLLFDAIFVLLLTAYVITALAHDCYNKAKNITVQNPDVCIQSNLFGTHLISNIWIIECVWYVLLMFTFIVIARKLIGIGGFASAKQYFSNITNTIEWFVIASVFLTSFVYTKRTYHWQNHVGAFAVLFGWSNLMVLIGQLPIFGTYIAMFTKVQAEFAKLLLAYSCLLIGFTISFCVIFPTSSAFNNPLIGIVKVLVMMTGELDLDLLIGKDEKSSVILNISAHIIFVMFLVFVTVVLMNLLVGIAVHDIQGLHKTAGLSKLVRQTQLIYLQEQALFQGFLPRRITDFFNWSARVSPLAYRVVLYVKPLNPREKRLPKEIMDGALNIARQKRLNIIDCKQAVLENKMENKVLVEEIKQLKDIVQNQQKLLLELIKKSDKMPS